MPIYKSKAKTKDGRQWYFTVSEKTLDGKYKVYKSKKYITKREASNAENMYRIDHRSKHATIAKITFNDIIPEYIASKRKTVKPQTIPKIEKLCQIVSVWLGDKQIDKLSTDEYERFKQKLEQCEYSSRKHYSLNYLRKIHVTVKALVLLAKKKYGISSDAPELSGNFERKDYQVKKKIDFFTKDEFDCFISQTDNIIWKAFFTVLFFCGLRCGEANALTWKDFVLRKSAYTLSIEKTVTTKMRGPDGEYLITTPKTKSSVRTLPLPERVSDCLLELKRYYSSFDGFDEAWFIFGGIRALPETTIQKQKNSMCKAAGLKQIRIHDFRHSCASLLINNGASITAVASYLGHSDVEMTLNTYSHLYLEDLVTLAKTLDTIR